MPAKKVQKLYHVLKGFGCKSKDSGFVQIERTKDLHGNVKDPVALTADQVAQGKKYNAIKEA